MAYVTPTNRSTGDLITSAIWNADVVENVKQNTTEKVTTAGDIVQATASKVIARLGMSGNGGKFLRANAGATALEYAAVPSLVAADAFEWGTKVANRYTAFFGSADLWSNAVLGDLLDAGWRASSPDAVPSPQSATTGDLDSASDPGEVATGVQADLRYIASPKVIGGKALLDAIEQVVGTRPTTINCWFTFKYNTNDPTDTVGVGIATDGDAVLATVGRGYTISPGATNFELWDGATATDLGVAKDANQHVAEIEITIAAATYRVLLDGVERKAAAAIVQDQWPMCMNAYRGTGNNDPLVFAWGVNYD